MNRNPVEMHRVATVKIVGIYALFGFAWIYGSDTVLGWFVSDASTMVKVAVVKGSLFILCTAILLYLLISRFARQLAVAKRDQIESLKSYEAIFNATNEAIFVHDAQSGRIVDVNDRIKEIFGFERDEAMELDIGALSEGTPPYSHAEAVEKIRSAMTEGPQVFEWRTRKKNGELFWCEVSLKRVSTHDYDRIIAVVRDISDRKEAEADRARLESQLQQAHKIEFMGRLAGGVAHDFNNMLTVILGQAELALLKIEPSNPFAANFTEIKKTAERSADLTRQLLAFARKQTVAPKLLDLNEKVTAVLNMLQRIIGENVHLIWQPAPEFCMVKMDPSQIDQILTNLCVNARDAIEGSGTISIETANSTIDADYYAAHLDAVPGEYVRLTVSDDGRGMDKETLAHIFEPFFTTKEVGKGTGLGLATVYGVVEQNNGFITSYSEPEQGSTFSIYLPRYIGTLKIEPAYAEKRVPGGQETILLVEDEAAILKVTAMMLREQGYAVLAANSPGDALRIAREHAGAIDLLMTDVIMPEINGLVLAEKLRAIHPDMKQLFMSGYTANVIAHHGVLDEGMQFIQKPFSLPNMAAKVREVLDGTPGEGRSSDI